MITGRAVVASLAADRIRQDGLVALAVVVLVTVVVALWARRNRP